MAGKRIRFKSLDENLPEGSALREFLVNKDETASVRSTRPAARLVPYCPPFGRIPDALLVMPPMRLYEGAVKRVVPPLGLCYTAAALEQQGIDVAILDCIVEGIDDVERTGDGTWRFGMSEKRFAEYIESHDYDVVGFAMIYSSDLENLYRYARIVKTVRPGTIVVAGGLHASIYAERFLRDAVQDGMPCVDLVIRGEGESRLGNLLRSLVDGQVDANADGLAGWLDGRLFVNPQYDQIEDLDALAFPAYDKVPIEKYFAHNVPFSPYPRGHRVMQLYTSRGCPVGCTFCASTNFAKIYRYRSVDNVIAEIRSYQERYQIDEIQFADDNLTFLRSRATELFKKLAPLGLPWCTPNGIMVNTLDAELIDRMADSGLYQITLSVDSGSAKTLKERHRKPVNLQRLPDLMAYIDSKGILMHGTLVVGMPGETEADIEEGFAFIETLPFHSLNVFIAQAIPGSELFERALSSGTITYEAARHIDTAKSTLRLTSIEARRLESLVESFLQRFNQGVYARDPDAWNRKYDAHRDRMGSICVGVASPNTSAILRAET